MWASARVLAMVLCCAGGVQAQGAPSEAQPEAAPEEGVAGREEAASPPPVASPPAANPEAAGAASAAQAKPSLAQPVIVGRIPEASASDARLAPGARELTLTERLLLRQQWMTYRERDRRQVGVAVPAVVLTLGAAALAAGYGAIALSDEARDKVATAIPVTLLLGPLVGISAWVLAKRVKKRRAIEREIWEAPPISGGPFRWAF